MTIKNILREETYFVEYQGVNYVRKTRYMSSKKETSVIWRTQRGWKEVTQKISEKLEKIYLETKNRKKSIITA